MMTRDMMMNRDDDEEEAKIHEQLDDDSQNYQHSVDCMAVETRSLCSQSSSHIHAVMHHHHHNNNNNNRGSHRLSNRSDHSHISNSSIKSAISNNNNNLSESVLRQDYENAVDCVILCQGVINKLQDQLASKDEELASKDERIANLEEKLVEMSLELAGAKSLEDEHLLMKRKVHRLLKNGLRQRRLSTSSLSLATKDSMDAQNVVADDDGDGGANTAPCSRRSSMTPSTSMTAVTVVDTAAPAPTTTTTTYIPVRNNNNNSPPPRPSPRPRSSLRKSVPPRSIPNIAATLHRSSWSAHEEAETIEEDKKLQPYADQEDFLSWPSSSPPKTVAQHHHHQAAALSSGLAITPSKKSAAAVALLTSGVGLDTSNRSHYQEQLTGSTTKHQRQQQQQQGAASAPGGGGGGGSRVSRLAKRMSWGVDNSDTTASMTLDSSSTFHGLDDSATSKESLRSNTSGIFSDLGVSSSSRTTTTITPSSSRPRFSRQASMQGLNMSQSSIGQFILGGLNSMKNDKTEEEDDQDVPTATAAACRLPDIPICELSGVVFPVTSSDCLEGLLGRAEEEDVEYPPPTASSSSRFDIARRRNSDNIGGGQQQCSSSSNIRSANAEWPEF